MREDDPLGLALKKIAEKADTAPATLQAEIFSTLDTLQLMADVVELFTAKFAETELLALDAALSDEEAEPK